MFDLFVGICIVALVVLLIVGIIRYNEHQLTKEENDERLRFQQAMAHRAKARRMADTLGATIAAKEAVPEHERPPFMVNGRALPVVEVRPTRRVRRDDQRYKPVTREQQYAEALEMAEDHALALRSSMINMEVK